MRHLLVTGLVVALAGCGGDEPPARHDPAMFTNPVYAQDAPDPQAIRVGETWYLYTTNGGGKNVPVLTSTDLVHWSPAPDALPKLPAWADPGKNWAPEVIALAPDRYAMYYTVADAGSKRQCVGVAIASAPGGPFVDSRPGPLVCQTAEGGSIDASPFRDIDGTLYLLWKNDGNAVGRDTWIYVQKLAPDGTALVGSPTRLISQTEFWEGDLVEGPFFWRREGRLYLFYSANAYYNENYAMGYAVCDSPTGPCHKAAENPILRSAPGAAGPGHGFMVEHKGRTWMLYHAWPPGSVGAVLPGRQIWLDEVIWPDGKPTVKGPTADPQPVP